MTTVPMQASAEVDAKPQADDERLWSVTTILKSYGDAQALIEWSAGAVADEALDNLEWYQTKVEKEGRDKARRDLIDSRYRPRAGERSATALGEGVHAAIEILVVTGKRPAHGEFLTEKSGVMDAEIDPYLDSFEMFLDHAQPEFQAAEMTVYNTTYGYAGTTDAVLTLQGVPVIGDYKSSKKELDGRGNRSKPWKDSVLQVNAYKGAEFVAVWRARRFHSYSRRYYLLNEDERAMAVPMPETDGGVVIHITPRHCDVWPVPTGDDVFERFLYALENARTDQDLSRGWLREPLMLLDRKVA